MIRSFLALVSVALLSASADAQYVPYAYAPAGGCPGGVCPTARPVMSAVSAAPGQAREVAAVGMHVAANLIAPASPWVPAYQPRAARPRWVPGQVIRRVFR